MTRKQRLDKIQYNKEFIRFYLEQNRCVDCGEDDLRCLDFDHLPEFEKICSISKMVNSGYKIETILKEIDKCQIRCSNCHRKITWVRRNQEKPVIFE